jgi:hypothetical protein
LLGPGSRRYGVAPSLVQAGTGRSIVIAMPTESIAPVDVVM